jgi:hypothetical protein
VRLYSLFTLVLFSCRTCFASIDFFLSQFTELFTHATPNPRRFDRFRAGLLPLFKTLNHAAGSAHQCCI